MINNNIHILDILQKRTMIFWLLNFDNFFLQHNMLFSEKFWNIENEKNKEMKNHLEDDT